MQIFVRTQEGKTVTIDCSQDDTVLELKKKIEKYEGISFEYQVLILGGRELQNEKTLSDYGIHAESTIYLVQRLPGGGPQFQTFDFVDMKNKIWTGFSSDAPK